VVSGTATADLEVDVVDGEDVAVRIDNLDQADVDGRHG
jgi:hypothetical protein